jgi:gliding motility-associated-like protein
MNRNSPLGRAGSFLSLSFFALLLIFSPDTQAQVTLTPGASASALATALTGTGVIVLNPVLNCNASGNAIFTTGATDPIGVSSGITLESGDVSLMTAAATGPTESSFFTPSLSDADLSALIGGDPTNDACVLEFDFKAAGDTVKFDYVFASEEYPEFACSSFNDVFGFLISGGVTDPLTTYSTPYNIARVPGTNIPVCINSVNSAPTGTSYAITTCNALGPGSPFNMYYIDNSASTMLVFDGKTTVLTAVAAVSPCDTYHLKLGVADVVDNAYNSAVFIKGGSLTSTTATAITATGTSGLPYCIRGCGPGNFIFTIPSRRATPFVIHYNILGSAVNGYDYATIPDSVIIPVTDTFTILDISTLPVPPAGPKIVTIQILNADPCTGALSPGGTASLTIMDSFNFHILTPDTAICAGQTITLRAVGDPDFTGILTYEWTPTTAVVSPGSLYTATTPTITTTYILTATAPAVLGCTPQIKSVTVSMFPNPDLTIDSALVKTCLGIPVPLNVYTTPPPGVAYTYAWSPGLGLSTTLAPATTVTPTILGDITYTVTVHPTLLPACATTKEITVHTVPNDFILLNPDTAICIGEFVQTRVNGTLEFNYLWTPPGDISDPNIKEPVITPTVSGSYTLTASYAHCPDMVHGFHIEVDTPAPLIIRYDTICIPMTHSVDLTVPWATGVGEGYYSYRWTPATYVSNDTIPNPTITPILDGAYVYTVTVQPHAVGCAVNDIINLYVLPNTISLVSPDTAICRGKAVQIRATGHPLFEYQWLPTSGIAISNVVAPLITPDTSALYKVRVSFHLCPSFYDSVMIDVQPVPNVFIGGNRFVCEADTIRIKSGVTPGWYEHYSYSWTPSTYLNVSDEPNVILTGVGTGALALTVTTPAGCTGTDTAQIIVLPGNFATLDAKTTFCPHDSAVLAPEGGVSYQWLPAMYLSNATAAAPVIHPITTQSYSIIATSADGCKDTLYYTATVYPGAVFNMPDSVTIFPGESYEINPQTNCTHFSWTPAGALTGKYISNPVATPEVSTLYRVTGVTEYGCVAKDSILINVNDGAIIELPNAFAPGRGVNDEFKIIKRGIATLNYFRIFNRWGNLVFETKDINEGWNGAYKGVPQPVGVFVYQVEAQTQGGKIVRKQGNVTLLR